VLFLAKMHKVFYNELRELKQQSQKAFHTGLDVTTKKEKGKGLSC
jgi:hypothetical protein